MIERIARERHAAGFVELGPDQQDDVLAALEAGEGESPGFSPPHFFSVLFTLTLEGLLSDPIYGGNRDEYGWKIIQYAPGRPLPGHAHAQG